MDDYSKKIITDYVEPLKRSRDLLTDQLRQEAKKYNADVAILKDLNSRINCIADAILSIESKLRE